MQDRYIDIGYADRADFSHDLDREGSQDTLARLATTMLGRFPSAGKSFEYVGLRCEVALMERLLLEKILIKPMDRFTLENG